MGPGLRRLLGVTVFVLGFGAQRTSSGRLDLSFPAPCAPLRCSASTGRAANRNLQLPYLAPMV
ncbi:MAG: hypothetical protein ACJ76X_02490 [Solirubrobacteraceae bacterium]